MLREAKIYGCNDRRGAREVASGSTQLLVVRRTLRDGPATQEVTGVTTGTDTPRKEGGKKYRRRYLSLVRITSQSQAKTTQAASNEKSSPTHNPSCSSSSIIYILYILLVYFKKFNWRKKRRSEAKQAGCFKNKVLDRQLPSDSRTLILFAYPIYSVLELDLI